MLKACGDTRGQVELEPLGPSIGGGPEVARENHRSGEVLRSRRSGPNRAGISQSTPGLGRHPKHGSSWRRTGTSRTNGRNQHLWKRPLARKTDTEKRRIKIQDLVRHSLILCRAQVPQGRAPRGNLSRELSKVFLPEKCKGKGKATRQLSQSSMNLA